jgi:hypothetical protein
LTDENVKMFPFNNPIPRRMSSFWSFQSEEFEILVIIL